MQQETRMSSEKSINYQKRVAVCALGTKEEHDARAARFFGNAELKKGQFSRHDVVSQLPRGR